MNEENIKNLTAEAASLPTIGEEDHNRWNGF
jgi:hypothetical protein